MQVGLATTNAFARRSFPDGRKMNDFEQMAVVHDSGVKRCLTLLARNRSRTRNGQVFLERMRFANSITDPREMFGAAKMAINNVVGPIRMFKRF